MRQSRIQEPRLSVKNPLRIVLPEETVETGYGVKLKEQTLQTIQALAHEAGFVTTGETLGDTTFHLVLEKK